RRSGGASGAFVSSRSGGRGGLSRAGCGHQYWRRRQFKFYRAGEGADCLRYRTRQCVARRFDVATPWPRLRPEGFERTSCASVLTDKDVDDAFHVPTLLDQLTQDPASFMADGAYDRVA